VVGDQVAPFKVVLKHRGGQDVVVFNIQPTPFTHNELQANVVSGIGRLLALLILTHLLSPRLALTIFALLVLLFFVFRSLSHAFILSDSQDYEFIPDLPDTELDFHSAYQDALQTAKPSSTSRKWAPMVLNQCTPDMPTYFAPCLAERYRDSFRLAEEEVQQSPVQVYGEEVVYPDFALAPPLFVNEKQKERWLESARVQINERAYLRKQDNHMVYKGQHGQNFVSRTGRQLCFIRLSLFVGEGD
jgi:hypothetical protein